MKPSLGPIEIASVSGRQDIRDWLEVPKIVFAGDPCWVQVPDFFERRRVSPRHVPFFSFGEAALFIARRDGRPVGRISSQVNRRHLEVHQDDTGHFGFFDCVDDPHAAGGLIEAAATWLRRRGLKRMMGPASFSLNEEAGCLVDGFDSPPAVLMPHHPRWASRRLEEAGLVKEIDLLAYRNPNIALPAAVARIAARADSTTRVGVRPLDKRRFRQEIALMFEIANDAWSANWGFVPFSDGEIRHAARELRPVLSADLGQFLTLDGEEVGFILVFPNANEIFARMRAGSLSFLDPLRVYAGLLLHPPRTFRVPLMGIRRALQASRLGGALLAVLCRELSVLGARHRPEWTEMSWILETNGPMMRMAEMFGGPPVKRYRIYSRQL